MRISAEAIYAGAVVVSATGATYHLHWHERGPQQRHPILITTTDVAAGRAGYRPCRRCFLPDGTVRGLDDGYTSVTLEAWLDIWDQRLVRVRGGRGRS